MDKSDLELRLEKDILAYPDILPGTEYWGVEEKVGDTWVPLLTFSFSSKEAADFGCPRCETARVSRFRKTATGTERIDD